MNRYKAKKAIKEITRQPRKIAENSLDNLIYEKSKWNNTPTKAIRIPEIFGDRLLTIARTWDNGEGEISVRGSNTKDMKEAISILENSLTLKANYGGAIKKEIKKALKLLKQEN